MFDDKLSVPLSPPTSPRMSDAATKSIEYRWQFPSAITDASSATGFLISPGHNPPTSSPQNNKQAACEQNRPPLRSHRSFPYSLGPSSRLQHEVTQDCSEASALVPFKEHVVSQGPQPVGSAELPPAQYGGSAPTSPVGRLTPHSPDIEQNDVSIEDDEIGFGVAEQEDEEERPPMTAAELRAQKRKMKRFRLTHNQTRFLMSEFARQPHPDAAHRERLSREIPGLSPRQVQVWFQNRRAKLKRLTTDDRERVMRSRALPADFNLTQALHSPFGATSTQSMGTPLPSPGIFPPYNENSGARSLTVDTLRRVPNYEPYNHQFASPTGISPALGSFAFTPPQSSTETMSPGSAASNISSFSFQTQDSPRRNPFLPINMAQGFGTPINQMPRPPFHDRLNRTVGEAAGSPLRTSISYSALGTAGVRHHQNQQERSNSFSEHSSGPIDRRHQQRSLTGPSSNNQGPYGLGFSYAQMETFPSGHQQPQAANIPISQPALDMHSYRRASRHLAGPPITSISPYQAPLYTTPSTPQYSTFGPFGTQTFSSSYQSNATKQRQQAQQNNQSYAMSNNSQQFMPLEASADGPNEQDNSPGGVHLQNQYH